MKRLAIFLLVIIVLAAGALVAAPILVSSEVTRERVTEQIARWIGRPVSFAGEPEISLFPQPTITLADITIEDAAGEPFITSERLTGTVRLLPLLIGRVEIREFELERPVIALRVDREGRSNWTPLGTVGSRVAAAGEAPSGAGTPGISPAVPVDEVTLGQFRIIDGTITYDDPDSGPTVISSVDLDIAWPSTSEGATARGSLVWRGEAVEINASLAEPLELTAGRSTPGRFSITAGPLRISFSGMVGRDGLDLSFTGDANVTMPSLREVLRWTGVAIDEAPTLGAASVSGEVSWAWPTLSFSSATMELDGNEAAGAFAVAFDGDRPRIQGTLAFETLDLSPYALSFQTGVGPSGDWSDAPISLPVLQAIDADIRLSAGVVTIGPTRIDDVAASALVNDGQAAINLGQAGLYGGRLQGTVNAELRPPVLSGEAHFTLADLDAQPALTDMVGLSALAGAASATLDIEGSGSRWGDLIQNLTGSLDLGVLDGTFHGVDLAAAAESRNPIVAGVLFGEQVTPFDTASARLSFADGRVMTSGTLAEGPSFSLAFEGWGSLIGAEVAGSGLIRLRRDADAPGPVLAFDLTGTWQAPRFAFDEVEAGVAPAAAEDAVP